MKASAIPYWFSARLHQAAPGLTVGYGAASTVRDELDGILEHIQ